MTNDKLNNKWFRVIITGIAIIIGIVGNDFHQDGYKNLFISFIICIIYLSGYWELNQLFFSYLLKKLPGTKNGKKRILMHLGFITGFVLLSGILLDVVNFTLPGITNQIYFLRTYSKMVERSLFFLGVLTIILEFVYLLNLYESSRIENQRLQAETEATLLKKQTEFKSRFLVKSGETYATVILSDIAYFSYENKLTFLYTRAGKKFMLDNSLDELEKLLNPKQFFRLNRQYLSSLDAIKSAHNYFNSKLRIYLIPDVTEEITVSKERAGSLKAWLDA